MRAHRVAGTIGVLCCVLAPLSAKAGLPEFHLTSQQRAAITSIATQAMKKQRIPGMVVAVAVTGHAIYEQAFGDRSPGKTTDVSTVFPIGSITKQFAATCVMWLAEKHRLDLDSSVDRYVPSVPHGSEVTVRELLDQTSGLFDYTKLPMFQAAIIKLLENDVSPVSLDNLSSAGLLTLLTKRPLNFRPGARFDYSDSNYIAAGMVIEAVSGETFREFLRQHILAPLRLTRTQYLRTSVPVGSDVAQGYTIEKNGHLALLPKFSMRWVGAAGALASDVNDLIRWDDSFFHGRVIAPALVRTMTTPPEATHETGDAINLRILGYGYGWLIARFDGKRMIWHNGGVPGAKTMNAYFPSSDMEIVVLTNLFTSKPEIIAERVYAAARRRPKSVDRFPGNRVEHRTAAHGRWEPGGRSAPSRPSSAFRDTPLLSGQYRIPG